LLLLGLLIRRFDQRLLLRRLANDRCEHEEEDGNRQATAEQDEFAFVDSVRCWDVSSRCKPRRRLSAGIEDG
jgi:hypothetical protein